MDNMTTTAAQAAYLAQNRQPIIYATHTPAFVLALLAVAGRFYTACRLNPHRRRPAAHDWLALAAGVGTAGVYACSMLWVRFGLGRHAAWARAQTPDGANIRRFLQTVLANEMLYTTTLACARLSLVVLYYRLFGLTTMRYWLHGVTGLIVAWALYSYIPSIFACWPISHFWEGEGELHNCINLYRLYTAVAVGSIVTDFLLMVLPLPYIWGLRTTTLGRRVLTGLLFVFGGMNCFITIIRVFIVLGVDMSDPTYNTVDLMIWTGMELYSATFSCCLPTLPPLFRLLSRRSCCGLGALFSHSPSADEEEGGGLGPQEPSPGSKKARLPADKLTFAQFDKVFSGPGLVSVISYEPSTEEEGDLRRTRTRSVGTTGRRDSSTSTLTGWRLEFETHELSLSRQESNFSEECNEALRGYMPKTPSWGQISAPA